jgi:broad specificity phosphatase PhoE
MRRFVRALRSGILVAAVATASPLWALETIYIVRHAEKVDFWPSDPSINAYRPLSEDGVATAEELADVLEDEGIAAIYGSRTTRALATGMPLAEQTGAPVIADDASTDRNQMGAFLAEVNGRHAADRAVLIVGHSNTVADLLVQLGAVSSCFERLGIVEDRGRLTIRGHGVLWKIRIADEGCDAIERLRLDRPTD